MRLLDLFCGAGGAAMGYSRAGFDEIVGIDVIDQPNYPFTFILGDALQPPVRLEYFDLIHASPPCQSHSTMAQRWPGSRWPDLIPQTRALLAGYPSVMENVAGARKSMPDRTVTLTGEMFGLRVHRPRLFELGEWWALVPAKPRRQVDPVAVYGRPDGRVVWRRTHAKELRAWASIEEGQEALGVPWITDELQVREAIPPAYAEYLGRQFLDQLARA